MFGCSIARLGITSLVVFLVLAEPATSETSNFPERIFWNGIEALHILFQNIASLAGGPEHGSVWIFNIETHARSKVTSGGDFAWPVQGLDNQTIFAVEGGQLVRVELTGGRVVRGGPEASWRKLLGIGSNGTIFGLVEQTRGAEPAFVEPSGRLSVVSPGQAEKGRIPILLQEDRAYGNNRRLLVLRSERGGRGFDVYYITDRQTLNVSDCGDDACGQPALSLNEHQILYVRSEQ